MRNGLLLGAGFSYDFGMPLAREFAEILFDRFDWKTTCLVSAILSGQQPFGSDRPIDRNAVKSGIALVAEYKKKRCFDYEALIAEIEARANEPGRPQTELDSYHLVYLYLYSLVKEILDLYQLHSFSTLYDINKNWFKHFDVLLGDGSTWAFILNHDIYLKLLCIDLGFDITYGDKNQISFLVNNQNPNIRLDLTYSKRAELNKKCLALNTEKGLNILKLHGGLTELLYQDSNLICNLPLDRSVSRDLFNDFQKFTQLAYYYNGVKIPDGKDRVITNEAGELDIATEAMLTGHKKYSITTNVKPGEEKLCLFDDAVADIDHLVIIGYSFGDKHINVRISNAMVRNPNMTVAIIDPGLRMTPDCLAQFDYGNRVQRAISGIAQWLTYKKTGKWDYKQDAALKENARRRAEIMIKVKSDLMRPPFPGSRTRPTLTRD